MGSIKKTHKTVTEDIVEALLDALIFTSVNAQRRSVNSENCGFSTESPVCDDVCSSSSGSQATWITVSSRSLSSTLSQQQHEQVQVSPDYQSEKFCPLIPSTGGEVIEAEDEGLNFDVFSIQLVRCNERGDVAVEEDKIPYGYGMKNNFAEVNRAVNHSRTVRPSMKISTTQWRDAFSKSSKEYVTELVPDLLYKPRTTMKMKCLSIKIPPADHWIEILIQKTVYESEVFRVLLDLEMDSVRFSIIENNDDGPHIIMDRESGVLLFLKQVSLHSFHQVNAQKFKRIWIVCTQTYDHFMDAVADCIELRLQGGCRMLPLYAPNPDQLYSVLHEIVNKI